MRQLRGVRKLTSLQTPEYEMINTPQHTWGLLRVINRALSSLRAPREVMHKPELWP